MFRVRSWHLGLWSLGFQLRLRVDFNLIAVAQNRIQNVQPLPSTSEHTALLIDGATASAPVFGDVTNKKDEDMGRVEGAMPTCVFAIAEIFKVGRQ